MTILGVCPNHSVFVRPNSNEFHGVRHDEGKIVDDVLPLLLV